MHSAFKIAATALLVLSGTIAAAKPPYRLTYSGGASGGIYTLVGAGLNEAIRTAYPGSVVTNQAGAGGGIGNIAQVARKGVDVGIAADIEARLAWAGQPPFQSPVRNMRVLAWAYAPSTGIYSAGFAINEDFAKTNGIQTLADLGAKKPAGLRLAMLPPTNLYHLVMEGVLQGSGLSLDEIKRSGGDVVRTASSGAVELMADRRVQLAGMGYAPNFPNFQQMARAVPIRMLPMTADVLKQVQQQYGGEQCTFKAAEDPVVLKSSDLTTLCYGGLLLVHEDMDEQTAYDLTRALVTNAKQYQSAYAALKAMVPAHFAAPGSSVPFHNGALRYFREAGLVK